MTAEAAGAASICIPKDTPWQRNEIICQWFRDR
ncbi:MAG: hypothetical protein IPK63_19005 [Candidatus Competibacteraceae bacterium]|nr:hypothetical protein [Candidatus Competibacteraceae bacterium]